MDIDMEDLPSSWAFPSLGEICRINPLVDKASLKDDTPVSFVPLPSVGAEDGAIDVSTTRPYAEVRIGFTAFEEGDVLFAKITPSMENGKMAVVPRLTSRIGFGSTEFHVIRPWSGIDPRFVYHWVSSKAFRVHASHHMTGAVGQKRVPRAYLAASRFPLPPIREQRRIVAKLEELLSQLDAGMAALLEAQVQSG